LRNSGLQPLAALAPAMPARHVRVGPDLVDEYDPLGIKLELTVEPVLALLHHVATVLLGGMRRLFARDPVTIEEAPQRTDPGSTPRATDPSKNPRRSDTDLRFTMVT
jgi:hypothetical protein